VRRLGAVRRRRRRRAQRRAPGQRDRHVQGPRLRTLDQHPVPLAPA
jgi:hypothetical protein